MATILVVDDQPASRQFLVTLLRYFKHVVLEAGDGIEALESLRNCRVDLVIADVLMPTMDGYDFLKRLRGDGGFEHTPVIFYSGVNFDPDSRGMERGAGPTHFLAKPAEPRQILAAVDSALGTHAAQLSAASLIEFDRRGVVAPADPIDPHAVVLVVDDDPAVQRLLSGAFTDAGLKAEFYPSAEEFLKNYDARQPSCLVLDIRLPGISGIALLEILRSRRNQIPAIILTAHGNTLTAVDAMRLRVVDFLEKPTDRRILLTRVYRALQEDSITRRKLAEAQSIRNRLGQLSAREKEVLKLLLLGKTSKEIGVELRISAKTVSHHRAHLFAKTRAGNLAELLRMSMTVNNQ